jgi:hypothetical protein
MAEPTFFQWQNPVLLRTIYPRRNRKLAHFLIFCKAMDLWEEHKDKEVEERDREEYIAERDQALMTAYKSYKTNYAYFTNEDVRTHYAAYKLTDEAELAPIRDMHAALKKYLPSYGNVRKEINLIAWYVSSWQQMTDKLKEEQKRLKRRLELLAAGHKDRLVVTQQLSKLEEVTLPIREEEHKRLVQFVSAYNKIDKRKREFYKARETAEKDVKSLRTRLEANHTPLRRLEVRCRELSADVARLRTLPKPDVFKGYFEIEDIFDQLRRDFPEADSAVIDVVRGLHRRLAAELRSLKGLEVARSRIGNYLDELKGHYDRFLKEVNRLEAELRGAADPAQGGEKQGRLVKLRDTGLKAVEMELDRLSDYHVALTYSGKTQTELTPAIQKKEAELQDVQKRLSDVQKQVKALEEEFEAKQGILKMEEIDYLVRFRPEQQPVTIRDIVRTKLEKYKERMEERINPDLPEDPVQQDLLNLQIQQELLEEIVQRFLTKPGEFPLWVQYMVIHFSGMRYQTAHGSWADPKDLLKTLRLPERDRWFRGLKTDVVDALSQERLSAYEAPDPARSPKLALTTDQRWKEKIATHMRELALPHKRREALSELLADEESYEIDSMSPAEALEALKVLRAGKDGKAGLPDWMWKEITRLTELRVQEAKDPKWNELTPEERREKNEARYADYREIMKQWKEKYLTGWREEHDRSNRLIVTSSVCNEVAEQILHLRGRSPGGGLTGLVDWYMRMMREEKKPDALEPYFVFAQNGAEPYYREGATILWLRFVHEPPNDWRKAKPMVIDGVRLIPDKYRSKEGKDGEWSYFEDSFVRRTRSRVIDKKRTARDEQWLRWIHAATVAKVADTADGPVVLTFETALPYDDPSVSAVGVFERYLPGVMWDGGEDNYNGSYIAYVTEGDVPVSDLEEMLDWNRILRRQVMSPSQWEDYRKNYLRRP